MGDSSEVLRSAIKDFRRSVEITRDVRFQANLRLNRRQQGSSYVVAMLSLYVIALSLIPNIIELKQYQNQILLSCSIVLSVFVIFTSLLDGSQNFYHQGELLHQCARRIAAIHYDLKNIDIDADLVAAWKEFEKLQGEYRKALDECPINHDNMDYMKEMAHKPHLFKDNYPTWPVLRGPYGFYLRCCAKLSELSWLFPHGAAFIFITLIVYSLVINGAPLKSH